MNAEAWQIVGRPGYVGRQRQKRANKLDASFGAGRWRIEYFWKDEIISREEALNLYDEAYYRFLAARPDILDWLCATASDVYDTSPSNVNSGLDYLVQDEGATHLQDIAVRRAVKRLGRRFEGDHLVEIRGRNSEGYALNPGGVPFHEPELILQPRSIPGPWVEAGSVEDFWQSNKVLTVDPACADAAQREHVLCQLEPAKPGEVRVALFGGSFNPIHHGHLRVAQDLLDRWGFGKVLFAPNGNGYRKKGLIDETHRARMVELAIEGEPRFALCSFELGREIVAYSNDTLSHVSETLKRETPEAKLYNVRGSDTIVRMLRWKSLPSVLQVPQIVPLRPGIDLWQELGQLAAFRLHCGSFRFVPGPFADGLSSSLVRSWVRDGRSIRYWVPEAVRAYIQEHRLYAR